MSYYRGRYRRRARPKPRAIVVKYAGPCICCGAEIKAGESATYYPPGTILGITDGKIGHFGGLEGTGERCFIEMKKRDQQTAPPKLAIADQAANDYAGDGLDERVEDDMKDACGL